MKQLNSPELASSFYFAILNALLPNVLHDDNNTLDDFVPRIIDNLTLQDFLNFGNGTFAENFRIQQKLNDKNEAFEQYKQMLKENYSPDKFLIQYVVDKLPVNVVFIENSTGKVLHTSRSQKKEVDQYIVIYVLKNDDGLYLYRTGYKLENEKIRTVFKKSEIQM